MRVAADAGNKMETWIFVMMILFLFTFFFCALIAEKCHRLTNGGVRHDDHDICVGGEDVDEGRKVGVPHFHALEGGRKFTAIKRLIGESGNMKTKRVM